MPTHLRVLDETLTTLCAAQITESNWKREHVIVAVPGAALEGLVVDQDAAPIAGATVQLAPSRAGFVEFPYALESSTITSSSTESDSMGRFGFESAPLGPGLMLHVSAIGYEPAKLDAASLPAGTVVVELSPPRTSDESTVEGVVLDERGFPVEGALVRLADNTVRSDGSGHFRLVLPDWVWEPTPLVAMKQGRLPALIPDFGTLIETYGRSVPYQELVLGGEPRAIAGRVVDADGRPCEKWLVSITDETEVDASSTAEGLTRGGYGLSLTEQDGSFRIEGLFPREYQVCAVDKESLTLVEESVLAGREDVEIRVPAEAARSDLRGRVLTRRGIPVENARVSLQLDLSRTTFTSQSILGSTALTGEDGRFAFTAVPREHAYLSIHGDGISRSTHELPDDDAEGEFEIEVLLSCHFQIEPADPAHPADEVELVTDDGRRLLVSRISASSTTMRPRALLDEGRSGVLSVSEEATTAVLYRDDVEVGRVAIELDPAKVTVLRL